MAAFYDLCVPVCENNTQTLTIVQKLVDLGYQKVALNFVKEFADEESKGKKKKRKGDSSQSKDDKFDPKERFIKPILAKLDSLPRHFELLSRITVKLSHPDHVRFLRESFVQTFDILAVEPDSEKIFHQACVELDIDIISLSTETRIPYRFKHTSVRSAIDRNIHFELVYSPCIRSSYARKQIIGNALKISRMTKGKNIILGSGAQHFMEVRGPCDVINLSLLFGVREDLSKNCIAKNCQVVVSRGFSRTKSAKSVFTITKLSKKEVTDQSKSMDSAETSPTVINEIEKDSDVASNGFSLGSHDNNASSELCNSQRKRSIEENPDSGLKSPAQSSKRLKCDVKDSTMKQ